MLEKKVNHLQKIINSNNITIELLKKKLNWNDDQISALIRNSTRGMRWSNETIMKSLQIKFACKTSGYKILLKEGYPLPSERTLYRSIENLDFSSGPLDVIFELLKHKVETFFECEKECMMTCDEMSIIEGRQYDPKNASEIGVIDIPLFKSTNTINASKALVFMIGGISSRWKQTIAYYLTGNSINPSSFYEIVISLIEKCEAVGLKVNSFTSDMGPCNQRLWKDFGINASRIGRPINYVIHPCDAERKLYFFADVPHLFKNVTQGFLNKDEIYFNQNIVDKYNLPTNYASIKPIVEIFNAQVNDRLRMTPYLGEQNLDPDHFSKMRVMTSSCLMSKDVATTLEYFSKDENDDDPCDASYQTTTWFIHILRKWFDIMSSRHFSLAISEKNIEKYNETMCFLKDVVDIFYNIHMGKEDGRWAPFQSGVIISTLSAMEIAEYLIVEKKFDYVMLGRFTQDCLENFFSVVRSNQSKPNAIQFKFNLKLITITQFLTTPTNGNYENDDRDYAINFMNIIRENSSNELNENNTNLDDVEIQMLDDEYLSRREKQVIIIII